MHLGIFEMCNSRASYKFKPSERPIKKDEAPHNRHLPSPPLPPTSSLRGRGGASTNRLFEITTLGALIFLLS